MSETFNVGCNYSESIEFNMLHCKVAFYESCNQLKRILLSLRYGRKFVPTQNEMNIDHLVNEQQEALKIKEAVLCGLEK